MALGPQEAVSLSAEEVAIAKGLEEQIDNYLLHHFIGGRIEVPEQEVPVPRVKKAIVVRYKGAGWSEASWVSSQRDSVKCHFILRDNKTE